jgi:hypothetical protein
LVKIFDDVDLSGGLLRGAMFYVGFGTSDTEMLSAGRYRQVYLLP